ncbi:MAG: glycerol-3-phosphate responsive antiterminator [Lachnospiraceae bacterium]|nr:glycerol-3-phosphate responsive antiterminator [Lachnospiraceae bacterium]
MRHPLLERIEYSPVIAAVKDEEGLEESLTCESNVIFVLYGDLMTIGDIVERIKDAGKTAIVHADLITGLSTKEISVDYLKEQAHADGIISTKAHLIKRAKELDMFAVMRFFVLDSMSLESIRKQLVCADPDCIEILPGLMPKIIKKLCSEEKYPLIAGGLISDKDDILAALDAGAVAVSATKPDVWFL